MLPFQPHFDQDKDFRAIVSDRRVTAISHYNEGEDCDWGKHTDADLAHNVTLLLEGLQPPTR